MHAHSIKAGEAAFLPQTSAYGHGLLGRIGAAFGAWTLRQRTMAQLSGLSDRELLDIGLTRADIPEVAAGHRRR